MKRPRDQFVQGSKIETALPSWRCPHFSHGAVDDMPLNSLASRARKRSQVLASQVLALRVLARHAGSIAVNLMGEPQAVHCGPWFCESSMGYFSEIGAQPGVPGSPASQPAALDLKGSDAITLISTRLHLGHSNNRRSKPIGPGEMRSSIILVWQCEQRRRSVAVKDCEDEGMMLPLYWAGALPISQSPITACLDGDGANLAQYTSMRLVNIDHY